MHAIYLACLIGGAVATIVFAALGAFGGAHGGGHAVGGHHAVLGHGHAAAHVHSAGHTQATPQAHTAAHAGHSSGAKPGGSVAGRASMASTVAGWTLSWISPLTIAAAALWFGGVGLIAQGFLGQVGLVLAILGAVLGAFLIRTMMAALIDASTPPLESTAEGALATVNATIRPDAAGEVIYELEGLTRSAPARSLDGKEIPQGSAWPSSSENVVWPGCFPSTRNRLLNLSIPPAAHHMSSNHRRRVSK